MSNRLPLESIRILDFSHVWAGPMLTGLLADMGAQVIKIETRGRLDLWRTRPGIKYNKVIADRSELCPGFHNLNRNKMSITLNLKDHRAIKIVKELVAQSDIVNENMTAGTMDKLGIGYDELRKVKDDIIYISSCAFGQTGDLSNLPGYGPTMQALSGFDFTLGYKNERPLGLFAVPFSDCCSAIQGATAVMSALYYRKRTGKGLYIDFSQVEGLMYLIGTKIIEAMRGNEISPEGNDHPLMAPYNFYPCKGEDEWVSIAIKTNKEWNIFCKTLNKPEWIEDTRFSDVIQRIANKDELDDYISKWTKQYSSQEVYELLAPKGIATAPLLHPEQFESHPFFKERSFVQTVHPIAGKQSLFGLPWKFSGMPNIETRPAPTLGEHNYQVLSNILFYSEQEIAELKAEKVIY